MLPRFKLLDSRDLLKQLGLQAHPTVPGILIVFNKPQALVSIMFLFLDLVNMTFSVLLIHPQLLFPVYLPVPFPGLEI